MSYKVAHFPLFLNLLEFPIQLSSWKAQASISNVPALFLIVTSKSHIVLHDLGAPHKYKELRLCKYRQARCTTIQPYFLFILVMDLLPMSRTRCPGLDKVSPFPPPMLGGLWARNKCACMNHPAFKIRHGLCYNSPSVIGGVSPVHTYLRESPTE